MGTLSPEDLRFQPQHRRLLPAGSLLLICDLVTRSHALGLAVLVLSDCGPSSRELAREGRLSSRLLPPDLMLLSKFPSDCEVLDSGGGILFPLGTLSIQA